MFKKFLLLLCVIQAVNAMNSQFNYKQANVRGRKFSQQKKAPIVSKPKLMPRKDIRTNVQDIIALAAVVNVVVHFANQN